MQIPAPNHARQPRTRAVLPAIAAILMVASAAVAAVTISYTTSSTSSLALKAAPVAWSAGPDSSGNPFVSGFSLSNNATYYSVTLKPVPEATVTWGNLTSLNNQDTQAWTVAVTGSSVLANTKILDFRMEFRNYGTDALIGTLDLRQASPSLNLGSFPAGGHYYTKTYVKLDTATSAADLPASVIVGLAVS